MDQIDFHSKLNELGLEEASSTFWDVIIVGGGMGGSASAYSLCKNGLRVLVIEKGKSKLVPSDTIKIESLDIDPQSRLESGKWPTSIKTIVDGVENDIWAPLGCGLGGSSRWYAAALTRFEVDDFASEPHPNGGEISWPFTYSEIEPYYEAVEELCNVSGTADPLSAQSEFELASPPPMCELDKYFFESFEELGLHPYRMHLGVKYVDGCEGCGGKLCPRSCKQDGFESFLKRAHNTENLSILDEAEVLTLLEESDSIVGLVVSKNETKNKLRAKCFVLAAGAYFTPAILLNSKSPSWPDGLGNRYDQVGRNLMFHVSEFIAIWPNGKFSQSGIRSTIALRDFYKTGSEKFGELQSTGIIAGFGNILFFLHSTFDQSRFSRFRFLRHFLRLPAYIASKLFREATVFACSIEDFPYQENRVVVDNNTSSGIRVEYTVHKELSYRSEKFRRILKNALKNMKMFPLQPKTSPNFGHVCGTCAAGTNPEKSVVDTNCKVHGIDNLYLVDASIFPKSGGANPSLTIAANAVRVASEISKRLSRQVKDKS